MLANSRNLNLDKKIQNWMPNANITDAYSDRKSDLL